ncbi:MAG: hypothetical protein SOZ21_02740 [Candidatus Cryptobacteroides sp.]|nr:hypothetical protein [Candidatus Cryptobacteroides sp.]
MEMTKLFHQTLTDIILRIDELRQCQYDNEIDDEDRDRLLYELDNQYDLLYETVMELIFLDKPEEIDRLMIQTLSRHELPF